MFTGIIQSTGIIKDVAKGRDSGRFSIRVGGDFDLRDVKIGESVSVDGVCLTIVEKGKGLFVSDVSKETLKLTTLASVKKGIKVNLEKALKPSEGIGGHIVTGHVDGTGIIVKKDMKDEFAEFGFSIADELIRHIVKKGSIAVDGISLTVAEIIGNGFIVHLIPHTLKLTTLGLKNIGDKVNIETDIIGKYVERFLSPYNSRTGVSPVSQSSSIDEDFLIKHGFIDEG